MLTIYVNILIRAIIETYGSDSYCAMLIGENGIEYGGKIPTINLGGMNSTINFVETFDFGCQMFIVESDEPETILKELEVAIKTTNQRFGRRKLIFVPTFYDGEFDIDVTRTALLNVLNVPVMDFIPDVLLILPVENNSLEDRNSTLLIKNDVIFELITHKFVGIDDHLKPITLDYWFSTNHSFQSNRNLFPDKMADWEGRHLRISTLNYKPYAVYDESNNFSDPDGIEMRIALEYAAKHNCNVLFVPDNGFYWGQLYDNNTGDGILGNLFEDLADVGFGSLGSWLKSYYHLDLSKPLVRTGVAALVPVPRPIITLLIAILPFDKYSWLAVLGSFVLCEIAWKYATWTYAKTLKYKKDSPNARVESDSVMNTNAAQIMIRLYLGQGLTSEPNSTNLRAIFLLVLVMIVVLDSSYGSGLASCLTVPRYERPIDTVSDLADSRLEWAATGEAWIYAIQHTDNPDLQQLVKSFRVLTEDQMHSRSTTRDLGFAMERLPGGYFAIGDYITEKEISVLRVMAEDIYVEFCPLMFRKSSPHVENMNALLLRSQEVGLPLVWEAMVIRKHLNNMVQQVVKNRGKETSDEPVKITTTHLIGVYILWSAGLGLAVFCFTVELLVHRRKLETSNIDSGTDERSIFFLNH